MTNNKIWKPKLKDDDVELGDTQTLHAGHFKVFMRKLRFKTFSGGWSDWIEREQITVTNSAAVILYDPTLDQVVMVEQFRMGALEQQASPWLLEIVAGYLDPGETPEQTVIREAVEEANCKILKLLPILDYYTTPGGCTERTSVFCGLCHSPATGGIYGNDFEHEDIKVHVLPAQDVLAFLDHGMLTSSSTVIALKWLKEHRAHLQTIGYV